MTGLTLGEDSAKGQFTRNEVCLRLPHHGKILHHFHDTKANMNTGISIKENSQSLYEIPQKEGGGGEGGALALADKS